MQPQQEKTYDDEIDEIDEIDEEDQKDKELKLKIVQKFDILAAKLLKKYKPTKNVDLISLFDVLKCQIEYVLKRLKDKMPFNQIFVEYFRDLFMEKKGFKATIPNHYFDYIDNIIDYLNGAQTKFLYKYEEYSLEKNFYTDIYEMMKILNYDEIIGSIIINIMEIKNKENKEIFLKYFIPLFQLKINVKIFGGFREASLKELIDGFVLTCREAAKRENIPPCRLNFDKKKRLFIVNSLGTDDFVNYINNDITFVDNETEESKKSNDNNYIENKNKESIENVNEEKEEIVHQERINFNVIEPPKDNKDKEYISRKDFDEFKKNYENQIDDLNDKTHFLELENIKLNKTFNVIKLRYAIKCLINCLYYGIIKKPDYKVNLKQKISEILEILQDKKINNAKLLSNVLPKLKDNLKKGNFDAHEIDTSCSVLEQIFMSIDPMDNYMSLKNDLKNKTNIEEILKKLIDLKKKTYYFKNQNSVKNNEKKILDDLNINQINSLIY